MIRMRRPESVKLNLADGDWLLVKKHLTAGEQRAIFRRMMRDGMTGDQIDSVRVGWSKMIGYLLDWSVVDADDKPVVIADQSDDVIGAALDALPTDAFQVILAAIEKHEDQMEQERKKERQRPFTESGSFKTSSSPAPTEGGPSTTSKRSTRTSTTSSSKN